MPFAVCFWLPHLIVCAVVFTQYTSRAWHALAPLAIVWLVVPLLDIALRCISRRCGRVRRFRTESVSGGVRARVEKQWRYRLPILSWTPLQLALFVWAARRAADVQLVQEQPLRIVALLASMSLVATGGINCAHELLHKSSTTEQLFGQILLVSVCYGHFFIEHARGHHKRVATPHDPATLQFGETFYHFLPKTIIGGFSSAWNLEETRLTKAGLSVWSYRNAMLWYIVSPFVCFVIPLATAFGSRAVVFYLVQSLFAVILLEQVNAIEHYGLVRRKLSDGSYEPVGPQHSWDASFAVSNFLLFKLQCHADHHMHSSKRYQLLEPTVDSPQLPCGYLTLAPCLLVPPLWRALIDPCLVEYQAQLAALTSTRDGNVKT